MNERRWALLKKVSTGRRDLVLRRRGRKGEDMSPVKNQVTRDARSGGRDQHGKPASRCPNQTRFMLEGLGHSRGGATMAHGWAERFGNAPPRNGQPSRINRQGVRWNPREANFPAGGELAIQVACADATTEFRMFTAERCATCPRGRPGTPRRDVRGRSSEATHWPPARSRFFFFFSLKRRRCSTSM